MAEKGTATGETQLAAQFNRDVMHLCFWLCLLSYCMESIAFGTAGSQIAFGEAVAC